MREFCFGSESEAGGKAGNVCFPGSRTQSGVVPNSRRIIA